MEHDDDQAAMAHQQRQEFERLNQDIKDLLVEAKRRPLDDQEVTILRWAAGVR